MGLWIESSLENNLPVPAPFDETLYQIIVSPKPLAV
jgi:hypothetical protein